MDRNAAQRFAGAGEGAATLWRRGWEPRYRAIACVRTGGLLGAKVSLGSRHRPSERPACPLERARTCPRLDDWLLAAACGEAARWNRGQGSHLRIAVNVGTRLHVDPRLAEKVAAALVASGLRPERLELEVAGTVGPGIEPRVLRSLSRLRELGVRLTLDDALSGYSNLAYLRVLPFQAIKLGPGLLAEWASRAARSTRLEGILELARALRIVTVAEGVEDPAQRSRLAELGCDEVMGGEIEPGGAEAGLSDCRRMGA